MFSTEREAAAVSALFALAARRRQSRADVERLKHPNRNVKDPALRMAPADRALEPGMKHVAEEKWAWQANAARSWLKKKR